ncbi:MAG: nucleoside triphosphate pyrophosphohydrolase [Planctomycetota bacterium]
MSRDEIDELIRVVEVLRGPSGCPWDRKQTLQTVARYLLEESSEVADAIAESDGRPSDDVRDELGDVLMNVLLASRIAEEAGRFSIRDVARSIREKLIRRHPHVFGSTECSDADEVVVRWEEIKQQERDAKGESGPRSRLAGIPRHLPPLARARKISSKAADVGFDWPEPSGSLAKVREELDEVAELLETEGTSSENGAPSGVNPNLEEELGDVLFATVNLCRKLGVHPDDALRRTMKKFVQRFEYVERKIPDLESASLDEMDRYWNEIRHGRADGDPEAG